MDEKVKRFADVDAVISGHLSRRAFCGLAAAGMLTLAGCAGGGAADGDAGTNASDPAGDFADADGGVGAAAGSGASDAADAVAAEPAKGSTFAYNTLVSITAYGVDDDVVHACLADCATYEDLFSARKEGTDIDRVNAAAGAAVEVDPRTASLVAEALELCEASGGAFDITIGAVTLLWDFIEGVKPEDDAIAEAVRHVDYHVVSVDLDASTITLADPQARIDLGGVAKGWICRELARTLADHGATAALVNLGTSSVYALGSKPDGSPWRVGLHDPIAGGDGILGIVGIADLSITSSGLYDQKFEQDGVEYWHILDPATGYPAQTDMLGDTILGDDPMEGDATSTTLFVMGIDAASAWVEREHPQMPAMFVGAGDEQTFVNGFEEYLVG